MASAVAIPRLRSRKRRLTPAQVARLALAVVVSLFVIAPLVMAAVGGLKTTGEMYLNPLGLPSEPHWENYGSILGNRFFWSALVNSLIVTACVTVGVIVVAAMAAFPFARISFRGRELAFNFFMLGLLFPMAVAVLPLFVTLRGLHLLDSLVGVIIVEIAFALPASVLLLRSFFIWSVPREVEEAAYMDGCGSVRFFLRILLPMSRSSIAAVAVLTMVSSWNAYFLPLLVLNDQSKWTLPLGVSQYHGEHGSDWPSIMAFVTLFIIPAVIFYLIVERYLIAGLTAGALKG